MTTKKNSLIELANFKKIDCKFRFYNYFINILTHTKKLTIFYNTWHVIYNKKRRTNSTKITDKNILFVF